MIGMCHIEVNARDVSEIAGVLMSGRADWWRRVAYFGMFGALGWSFGGSISYMWVIGYTHSGQAAHYRPPLSRLIAPIR